MHINDLEQLTETLQALITEAIPDATSLTKYGGTLYTLSADTKEGQFCGVFTYQQHVQLSFSQGATLDDPDNLLEGTGKLRRHINFTSADKINKIQLTALIKRAAAHSTS